MRRTIKYISKKRGIFTVVATCIMMIFSSFTTLAVTDTIVLQSSTDLESSNIKPAIYSKKNDEAGPGAALFDGGQIMMLANQSSSQMMSFVITTKSGKLIVVDGGTDADAEHLKETIISKGGVVSAWLITHPHSDHVGAITKIINDGNSGINIESVYYNFTDLDWYKTNEEYRYQMVEDCNTALNKLAPTARHITHKGDVITVDDTTITVMNDPYLYSNNAINNSSVAYRVELNGVKTLFLGDMGSEGGASLLAAYPNQELACDIVQMAHHGEYGVSEDVYQKIGARIALWCSPEWLWNDDSGSGIGSGSWGTLEVREWMEGLGVTTNYCIKDGDQTIN